MSHVELITEGRVSNESLVEHVCGAEDSDCKAEASSVLGGIDSVWNDGQVDIREAFRYFQKNRFTDPSAASDIERRLFASMRKRFFGDASFYFKDGESLRLMLSTQIEKCEDGDTFSIEFDRLEGERKPLSIELRLAGIDTPESIKGWSVFEEDGNGGGRWTYTENPKVAKFAEYVFRTWDWMCPGALAKDRRAVEKMIRDRILYCGHISSVATEEVARWLNSERKGRAFAEITHNMHSKGHCGEMELVDAYGRLIVRLMASAPEDEDVLEAFIREGLPNAMGRGGMGKKNVWRKGAQVEVDAAFPRGMDYREYYTKGTGLVKKMAGYKTVGPAWLEDGAGVLERWKDATDGTQLLREALSPETLIDLAVAFSSERCGEMADAWRDFIEAHPAYKNDVQLMLVLCGLAYAYPKYRNEHTGVYLEAEAIAIERGFGLHSDTIFSMIRPDPNDPRTLAFRFRDEVDFTGKEDGKPRDLAPPDCSK